MNNLNKKDNSNNLFYNSLNLISDLNKFSTIEFKKEINNQISFLTVPQPAFNKRFNLLIENLTNYSNKGYKIVIFCSSKNQIKRFNEIFEKIENTISIKLIEKTIYKGFINHEDKEVCYSWTN